MNQNNCASLQPASSISKNSVSALLMRNRQRSISWNCSKTQFLGSFHYPSFKHSNSIGKVPIKSAIAAFIKRRGLANFRTFAMKWKSALNRRVCILQTRRALPPKDGGGYSSSDILAWAKIRYQTIYKDVHCLMNALFQRLKISFL